MGEVARSFLKPEEVAEALGVSREYVLKEIRRRRLGCYRVAGRVRITCEQMAAWLDLLRQGSQVA